MRRVYSAHGGAMATMLFDSSDLQGILFLAYGILKPGMVVESHVDPYEEIYYILELEPFLYDSRRHLGDPEIGHREKGTWSDFQKEKILIH